MGRYGLYLCIASILLALVGCSSDPEPASTPAAEPAPAPDAAADPLTGTWTGDWGPSATDRNNVTLELMWDGTNLTGTVNPGPNAVPLTNGSYDPVTGAINMEADAQGRGGQTLHYMIEGRVEGNMMTGSWNHPQRQGDFRLAKG